MRSEMTRDNKGFTLVEIVVVVVILVVLFTILIPTFGKYFTKSYSDKIKGQAKSVFDSATILFYEYYAENSHNKDSTCVISGDKYNSVDANNCYECDMHLNPISRELMKLSGLDMDNDDPCTLIVGAGRYDKYADPYNIEYDPQKAYTVYLVIYQPIFNKDVYYYIKGDDNLYKKWPSKYFTTTKERKNIIVDGVEIQLYYIKNGKDNRAQDSASYMWNNQIVNHS